MEGLGFSREFRDERITGLTGLQTIVAYNPF